MERAIIHSNLKKQEIQPSAMLKEYKSLLSKDLKKLFSAESLQDAFCPVTGEQEIKQSFSRMGMEYHVSRSLGNIYLSLQPTMNALKSFYLESEARKFWHTQLWLETKAMRKEKIILPQLQWIHGFINQYFPMENISIAEFLPNHWGYNMVASEVFQDVNYTLVNALFNPDLIDDDIKIISISENEENGSKDAALLFEALDRTVDSRKLLESAKNTLKPGGLCFITCLLASGFEVQLLGERSGIFVPPERMNIMSFEGMKRLIKDIGGFEILEFSTPGVLDIPNVIDQISETNNSGFFDYIFKLRQDSELVESFQEFLQFNCLGTFGRLVLKKQ